MKKRYWGMALALALALPMAAQAGVGYASIRLGLYAGPDVGYPYIATVPAGAPVTVIGCTPDWIWCDVFADGYRGWVAGEYLERPYEGSWVSIGYYGPRFGIPIVRFDLDYYWGHHYRGRRFYRDRDDWRDRDFHHEAPRYRYAPPRREYGHYEHGRPPVIIHRDVHPRGRPVRHGDRGYRDHGYTRPQYGDHDEHRGYRGRDEHRSQVEYLGGSNHRGQNPQRSGNDHRVQEQYRGGNDHRGQDRHRGGDNRHGHDDRGHGDRHDHHGH